MSIALTTLGYPLRVVGAGQPDSGWPAAVGYRARRMPFLPAAVGNVSWRLILACVLAMRPRHTAVVHVHLNRGLVALPCAVVALLTRHRLVLQTHGMCTPWSGPKRLLDWALTRPLLRRADLVLVLSDKEADELQPLAGQTSMLVLPNGLVEDACGDRDAPLWPTYLFCARLHPRKGLDVFVDAADLIQRALPDAQFLVVGPDEGALEAARVRARRNGINIQWLGVQTGDNVRARMLAATALIHPAEDEPLGMSMVEALARGLPVVTAASSRIAPLLQAAGCGVFAEGANPEEYAAGAIALHLDMARWATLSRRGQELYRSEFHVSVLETRLHEAYRGVLTGARRGDR